MYENLNIEPLEMALKSITFDPTKHNQGSWFAFADDIYPAYMESTTGLSDLYGMEPEERLSVVSEWSCQTNTACLAGHICLNEGDKPLTDGAVLTPDGQIMEAAGRAKQILGLNDREYLELLSYTNVEREEGSQIPGCDCGACSASPRIELFSGSLSHEQVVKGVEDVIAAARAERGI